MSELPFDQLVRFAGTRRALERVLDAQSDVRVLDVGGFPCTFARHVADCGNRWRVETVDMQEGALAHYRRITPGPLPFSDGEFDAVVSNDTLEHVPPDARTSFVAELIRVSRAPVILAAPFHRDAVAAVEEELCATHDALFGQPHPWLAEHRAYGLPVAARVIAALPQSARATRIEHNAPLMPWVVWHWSHIARNASEEFEPQHLRWDAACREAFASGESRGDVASYRLVITIAREGEAATLDESTSSGDLLAPVMVSALCTTLRAAMRTGGGADSARLLRAVDERMAEAMRVLEQQAAPRKRGLLDRLAGG